MFSLKFVAVLILFVLPTTFANERGGLLGNVLQPLSILGKPGRNLIPPLRLLLLHVTEPIDSLVKILDVENFVGNLLKVVYGTDLPANFSTPLNELISIASIVIIPVIEILLNWIDNFLNINISE